MPTGTHLPNIILITADALRYDIVRSPEDYDINTPRLEKLAGESLTFEQAFANGPHTRAAFPGILTGTYPWMFGGYESISSERPFIAETFDDLGYSTGGFHSNPYLGSEFNYDRGFDDFRSGTSSLSIMERLRETLTKRFFGDRRDTLAFKTIDKAYSMLSYTIGREFGTPYLKGRELNQIAIDWVESQQQPIFLWVHYMDPHDPYIPHDRTISEGISQRKAVQLQRKSNENPKAITSEEQELLLRLYRGEVEYFDECLGRFLDTIEGMTDEDLLTVFLSDHGEGFGEHGYFRHPHEFHDELIHVPLFVKAPDLNPGSTDKTVSAVDIFPTITNYVGLQAPNECIGKEILNNDADDRRVVFGQTGTRDSGKMMATDGKWKFILDIETDETTLYNRYSDPSEYSDLSGERPKICNRFYESIESHLDLIDITANKELSDNKVSGEVANRLEQLGYR